MINTKTSTNELIQEWLEFREEEINSEFTTEDKKYFSNITEIKKNILNAVSDINYDYVQSLIEKLDDNYMDYLGYLNEKYYKYGFNDATKLITDC